MAGLSDSKYTGKDCSMMIGITNPFAFELPSYLGLTNKKIYYTKSVQVKLR